MTRKAKRAVLALGDGTWFEGLSFGSEGESFGEVVFNTSMSGYQEILTDPSYKGQMVSMTYPLIGNVGANDVDVESRKPWVDGFIVREYCPHPSNWRMKESLADYLTQHKIVGIEGVDTRALTIHLRNYGSQKGVISTRDLDVKRLVKKAKESRSIVGVDLVKEVTCDKPYKWTEKLHDLDLEGLIAGGAKPAKAQPKGPGIPIAALDCGIKYNILRNLVSQGFDVTVYPASTSAEKLLASGAKGFFLSNGPGDPEAVPYVYQTVAKLVESGVPVFGICLGHQMLGLALGGKTYKLKFGHRGGNQPVLNTRTKKVEITSQNHGFAVDPKSVDESIAVMSHVNLSDNTSEGMAMKKKPVFSVQYHPEASPGPHDANYLFKQFRELVEKRS
jgi:carbamoyl-phosphate synthase small subunit